MATSINTRESQPVGISIQQQQTSIFSLVSNWTTLHLIYSLNYGIHRSRSHQDLNGPTSIRNIIELSDSSPISTTGTFSRFCS